LKAGELGVQTGGHLAVARLFGELSQLEQIIGALGERVPGRDLVAQPLGLAQGPARGALIGPEIGRAGGGVELVDVRLLGG